MTPENYAAREHNNARAAELERDAAQLAELRAALDAERARFEAQKALLQRDVEELAQIRQRWMCEEAVARSRLADEIETARERAEAEAVAIRERAHAEGHRAGRLEAAEEASIGAQATEVVFSAVRNRQLVGFNAETPSYEFARGVPYEAKRRVATALERCPKAVSVALSQALEAVARGRDAKTEAIRLREEARREGYREGVAQAVAGLPHTLRMAIRAYLDGDLIWGASVDGTGERTIVATTTDVKIMQIASVVRESGLVALFEALEQSGVSHSAEGGTTAVLQPAF